jgi:hypothetical protein
MKPAHQPEEGSQAMGVHFVLKSISKEHPVRLLHMDLWEAKDYKGKKRFGATALVHKSHPMVKAMDDTLMEVAKAEFGSKAAAKLAEIRGNNQKCAVRDGAAKGHPDHWMVATYRQESQGRPKVVDGRKRDLMPADGKPYRGCDINISFDFYIAEGGIHAGLEAVQYVRDNDAFSGAGPATADDFDEIAEGADADDLM